jgi:hypothetical protein
LRFAKRTKCEYDNRAPRATNKLKYKKSLSDLEKVAVKWWPKSLEEEVAKISVLPKLLETQDDFLSILNISGKHPEQVFEVLNASGMQPNLFLKHLVVLSDYGGEPIKRLGKDFANIFPLKLESGHHYFEYVFNNEKYKYVFGGLPIKSLENKTLRIDGKSILQVSPLNAITRDMIMLLLFAGSSAASEYASLDKCDLGGLLGKKVELELYVKQKYLSVSRITTGANTNSLGQIAQIYVADFLRSKLDKTYSVQSNGRVKLRRYDKEGGMPFDVVVKRSGKIVGVEVSFQVTSNSVIERKASLAEERKSQMGHEGYFVAYVLDGAGNFSRSAALGVLCASSDCTVAYSDAELATLVDFIRGKLDDPLR